MQLRSDILAVPVSAEASALPGSDNAPKLRMAHLVGFGLLLTIAYLGIGRLSFLFILKDPNIAAFWPANGLILAILMLTDRRYWTVWGLSCFGGCMIANLLGGRSGWQSLGFSIANCLEVGTAAGLMGIWSTRRLEFTTVRDVLGFVLSCAGGASLSGIVGAAVATQLPGGMGSFWDVWRLWAVCDSLGLLVFTPVIVTCWIFRPVIYRGAKLVEAVAILATFSFVCFLIFSGEPRQRSLLLDFPFVILMPFLLWAGLRFDPRIASLMVLILVSIGGWGTANLHGPMVRPGYSLFESVLALQFSSVLWTLSVLSLSAVTAERRAAAAAGAAAEKRAREVERGAVESHARLRAVFDNSTALIFLKDREGRYVEVNRIFADVIGRSHDQIVGRNDLDLFSPDIAYRLRETDRKIWASGEPFEYMTEWHLKGQTRTYRTSKVPVRDATGQVWAICGMSSDVTEQLAAERELRLAKERAETASRAKSEFLANISHEIRTPLTSIFGYAELLQSSALPECDRIEHVRTIRRNGEHLLAILNDVLDMSKIEAGRMTVENLPCPIPALVIEVTSLLRQRAEMKGLTLVAACRTPIPVMILTDPTRLRQILLNVIGNAIKFTESGQVLVDLSVDESHQKSELVIEVIDTGIGMTPEQVAALGQPFSQADPSHARRFGGSGLGLSIGYRLAVLLGGSITCQSAPGLGTKFTLRVPAGELAGVERTRILGDELDLTSISPLMDSKPLKGRLLVVEDSPDTLRLLLHHLIRAGLEVDSAENGQAAVARAVGAWRSNRPYDLILMDLQMPQMDGLTAIRVLRANGYTGRAVALTANAMEADRQRCVAAGYDGFLTKPILGDRLVEAVRHFLSKEAGSPGFVATPMRALSQSTGPADSTDAVNEAGAASLFSELNHDPDVGPLIAEYLHELRTKSRSIQQAAQSRDWPTVSRLAHQIKGSAGGYGYPSITTAAAKVESIIKAKLPDAAIGIAVRELLDVCGRATAPGPATSMAV